MKILMVTNNYADRSRGGVEMHILNLSRALKKAGHKVAVVRTSPGASVHELNDEIAVSVPLSKSADNRRSVVRSIAGLSKLRFAGNFLGRVTNAIKAGRILRADPALLDGVDVVHHHDFISSAIISRMLSKKTLRQVWTNHLGEFLIMIKIPLVGTRLTKYLTSSFTLGIGPSAELSDGTTVSCPITYIPNGVNTDVFAPLPADCRQKLRASRGWNDDTKVAIIPRRWAPTKGVLYAARAMSSPSWPDNCLVVFAGAGETEFPEYAREIRTELAKTNQAFEIIDSLSMSEMAAALQLADFCIIPSVLEATSLSALEAMSVEIPIVASNVGGLPEIIVDGVSGHLVPARDSESIATAVKLLCDMAPNQIQAMGANARTRVIADYSWDKIVGDTMSIYERAVQ